MKKWIIIIGLIATSLLFFVSGTLVGYHAYDKQIEESEKTGKPMRRPSERLGQVFGKVIDKQGQRLQSKVRVPSNPAISKAKSFKSKVL